VDPSSQQALARFEQVIRIWAERPVVELSITVSELDVAWVSHAAYGDPWDHFLSCRWAWPDPNAALRRTSWHCAEPSTAVRPETAEALEISARRGKTTILPCGLAHHQRHGKRMLDTLLIAGRETARTFEIEIVLDQEHAHRAILEALTPPVVIRCLSGQPRGGEVAAVVRADHPAVAVIHAGWQEPGVESPERLLELHMIETAGAAARCQVRLARPPRSARQTDFQGEPLMDLVVQDHAVFVDLTAHELARVEIMFDEPGESFPAAAASE
jgi:alpha-mannosidase